MRLRAVLSGSALLAASLFSLSARAEDGRWVQTPETVPVRLVEVGTWEFEATKRAPDGKPECYECWTFKADGTGLIVSGQQQVATRWEYQPFDIEDCWGSIKPAIDR